MTVGELREALAQYPAESLVVVDGYESGYDDPKIHTTRLCDEQGDGEKAEWWRGRYDDPWSDEDNKIDAVVVGR